ncbi:MAG: chitobiase/beta-hexosaminidase C-terminal domain-containing protein [Planctomycetes bacterium]|nr:chitobiase/beta-hexosaminidase C-terminal domain-containing protein [Planctomycetota bacterium]
MEDVLEGYAHESITVSSSAIGFTAATMKPEGGAKNRPDETIFVVETQAIRYTTDGTDPTSALGLLGSVGDVITIKGEANANAFRAIRVTTDATIQPHYFSR